MSKYPERPLGEVLTRASQSVPVSDSESYRITGIYSFGKGLIKRDTIQGSQTAYKSLTPLRTGQLVMSKLNAWEGALAVVPDHFDGTYVSPEYPVFEIDQRFADSDYVRHLVSWPQIWGKLTPTGSMVRRKRTSPETLLATSCPLPDLAEQGRVATRISTIASKIARISTLRNHAQQTSGNYIDATLREITKLTPLSAVLTESSDWIPVSPDGRYQTVGIYSHGRGMFQRPAIDGTETRYTRYNRLHSGQFVYSKLFGWEGALAMVEKEFDNLLVSHEFPTFNLNQDLANAEFFSHVARWPGLHRQLVDQGTGVGSRRQRVSTGRLLATQIPLPSISEQSELSKRLNRAAIARQMAQQQAHYLSTLHTSILNAAFTGQL